MVIYVDFGQRAKCSKKWSLTKSQVHRWSILTQGHFEAPNGKDIQKMRRLDVNLNGIVLCLMERIFTKRDGCHIQKTFLGLRRRCCMCKGYFGEWRNRKISIARVTWHLDAPPNGMLEFFFFTAGVYCVYLVYIIVCIYRIHRECVQKNVKWNRKRSITAPPVHLPNGILMHL